MLRKVSVLSHRIKPGQSRSEPLTDPSKSDKSRSDKSKSDPFKPGDAVQWHSAQGQVKGVVKQKLTEPMEIKGHHVAAAPSNPEYLVVSDKTGQEAAHKPDALEPVDPD
jgi:Hypervirulence associated proteins TUDOR domain